MLSRKIFFVLFILGLALLYASSRIQVVQLGYEVSKIKNEMGELERDNSLLRSKVASGKTTARIADWAKKLGMAPPDAKQILFVEESVKQSDLKK